MTQAYDANSFHQNVFARLIDSLGAELALATAAKQDTGNAALAAILAKIIAAPATEATLAAASAKLPAALAANGGLKIEGVAGGVAVPVSGPITSAQFVAALQSTPAFTSVASAATSTQLLAANAARKGLIIVNTDANALYIDISGGGAATTRYTKKLATDEQWECPYAPVTAITGIWASGGAGSALITELA